MVKKTVYKYLFILLTLLLPSCLAEVDTPRPLNPTTTVTISIATDTLGFKNDERPTPSRITKATYLPAPSPTSTPTLVVEGVSIPIEKKCPVQRVVPLEMLEIETQYSLLVLPSEEVIYTSNKIPPLIISPHDSQSAIITKLDTTRSHYSEAVSPDKKRIILYRPGEAENQDVVWVSSIDGEERFPVVQIDNKNLARWGSEEELLVLGRPNAEEFPKLEFWDYFPF
jgi:hypothetical protein